MVNESERQKNLEMLKNMNCRGLFGVEEISPSCTGAQEMSGSDIPPPSPVRHSAKPKEPEHGR